MSPEMPVLVGVTEITAKRIERGVGANDEQLNSGAHANRGVLVVPPDADRIIAMTQS